jgi:prepilin-type N-terminal cleavage/methylation domain-containing protein
LRILSEDRQEKGLTLIELAVVMAIVAIMGLFLAPAIGEWVDNFRIRQAARDVSSDLQFAKMKAIGSGVRYTVVFNQIVGGTTYSYVIFPDYDNDLVLDTADYAYDLNGDGIMETVNETTNILKLGLLGKNISFDPDKGGSDGIDFPDVSGHPAFGFNRSGVPIENSGPLTIVAPAGRIGINEY